MLILAAAAPLGLPKPCQAQPTADVAAKLELLPTSSMCSITLHQALDFAQVESPGGLHKFKLGFGSFCRDGPSK